MDPMGFMYTSPTQMSSIGLDVSALLLYLLFNNPLQHENDDEHRLNFVPSCRIFWRASLTRYFEFYSTQLLKDFGLFFFIKSSFFYLSTGQTHMSPNVNNRSLLVTH